ncbi:integrase [Cupriavidus plantarum]|uniref:integrase n=1 Tax=Cupriavidus plantarum TaxID=942865 RepID=UPI00339D5D68
MATVRKRGPYQWEAQIRRKGYPAQSKTFNTKLEAEAWASIIESEMARGVWSSRVEAESTSLSEALDRYESEILPSKRGAEPERSVVRSWRNLQLAKRTLASIRSSDVAGVRDEWLRLYKPATVLRRLAVLSHLFNIARKEWGMEGLANPVELIRKPQPNNARTRRLAEINAESEDDPHFDRRTAANELELIAASSGSALLPSIICLAVETAMRRGEIVSLRWEHVDLKRRVAHLPSTKNGSSRDVPLSQPAIAVLQTLRESVLERDKLSSAGQVFNIRSDAVTRAFERAVARARNLYLKECAGANRQPDAKLFTDLRFHDLRHEATSRLASIFPLHELTKITGHKDPRMLMRYYHPKAEDLAKRLG